MLRSKRVSACGEDGTISVLLATVALALMLMVGLVVDGGGRARAAARADDAAASAAVAAGQAVNLGQLRAGGALAADPARAAAAASGFLHASGVSGSAAVIDGGRRIEVTTHDTYSPVFLSLIGIGSMPVTGHAVVDLLAVQNGTEI